MKDIQELWNINDLDREYIRRWIGVLKLNTFELINS